MNYPINFRSRDFLRKHVSNILDFYDERAVDASGGFFHCYMNDGTLFNPGLRTLVASCRFVFNYAKAYRQFGTPKFRTRAVHGLDYLRNTHRNSATDGYAWKINDGVVIDATNHCYGLAFVMLAYACAVDIGVLAARKWIYETYRLMEQRFWLAEHGLYASEADAEWKLMPYRGQNDNMHACEAMIAAYEATRDVMFLDRACLLARNIAVRQAGATGGQIWEHFHPDWTPDLEYNRNDTSNSLRPWGIQTGHQTEWSKLLIILERHRPEPWRIECARELFDRAVKFGWDEEFTGLRYGYDLTGHPCDHDKYFWVQAESFAAAALLAVRSGDSRYWDWYDRIWAYAWEHFVDHAHGAWYRILTPENRKISDDKSPAGKTDYHTMGACYDVLRGLGC